MKLNLTKSVGSTMNSSSRNRSEIHHAISTEQFNQIIEAIMDGKYSWACLLLLQCFGYNPLHYIPYRTYNRLIKENRQITKLGRDSQSSETMTDTKHSPKYISNLTDLAYIEALNETNAKVRGGNLEQWWSEKIREHNSLKFESSKLQHQKLFVYEL